MVCTTLVWHRRDLRLADNRLYDGLTGPTISLYVFSNEAYDVVPSCAEPGWDVVRTGPFAARSLLSAVHALRKSLRSASGELLGYLSVDLDSG